MSGFITLHRKMLEWEWYQDANVVRVFLHCLLKANWKDGRYQGHPIPRGSFVTSRDNFANEISLSVQQVRTAWNKLKSTNEITITTNRFFTIITVTNYLLYQDEQPTNQPTNNQQITNNQPTNNQQITTIEQRNKETKKQGNKEIHLLPAPIPSGQEVQCLDAFIGLTLNTGESHSVTHGEIEIWQDLYPAVNVQQEIRNMQGWLLADKRRRKTKQGIGRFIQGWLSRAQDKYHAPQQDTQGNRPKANSQWQQDRQNSQDMAKMALTLREQEKDNGITAIDI